MNDTVREDLHSKITPVRLHRSEIKSASLPERKPLAPPPPMMTLPPVRRKETYGLAAPKTSPTLVEFQSKNTTRPEWRLQLQNLVQQRKGSHNGGITQSSESSTQLSAAAPLKAAIVTRMNPAAAPIAAITSNDPRVANAMRRIEESRKAFLPGEKAATRSTPKQAPNGHHPFNIVSPTAAAPSVTVNMPPKPQLVTPIPQVEKRVNTNKLPPITARRIIEEDQAETEIHKTNSNDPIAEFKEVNRIRIKVETPEDEIVHQPEMTDDEIEDLAPFSMRFSAGVFDLIIGGFAGMLLLTPLAFTSENWFSPQALLTVAATLSIVLFLYLTTCLGFFGKTMGMRLFSLELVDAVENEYPTLRQAAVNSLIFLLSLLFAGAGFLTVFFNEEKRAVHDIVSGTILVKEF